ncbi:Asp-tRNAAsn/Glu-tRNAGln amidotransferase A subunit [Rhizobiales bacterium GAS188]|nr:Asp-tRNAAsn/Glu-tRNAGln amidotransferase A subunit [Rhizobiales bacterium GAS188]
MNEAAPISVATIAEAERLLGVDYSDAERLQMLDNIAGQIELAIKRRAVRLPETLAPAMRFDPRLPDWTPIDPGPFRPSEDPPPNLPANDVDIAFAPVTHLASWIRGGQLTSLRLTEIYLERIERLGRKLACIAVATPDLAREQARRADRLLAEGTYLGKLHGIPWGAKDLLDTAGIATGWGAEPYRERLPTSDAAIVRKLTEAGAVLVAKTTLGALAYGDIWYDGRTRNPWNLEEGSSGSSAGSGSATAAGLVGFSIGTETLGSIVAPSIRCGTTGLRPTFGRVSRVGAMALCWSLDKIGAMCRTVEDTALVVAAINGFDRADPGSIEAPFGYDAAAPVKGLRVGYFPADLALPEAHDLDRDAIEAARRIGLELVPLERPDLPYEALMNILFAEAAAAFEALTLDNRDDELSWQEPGAWPNTFRKARFLSAVDHIQLDRLRRRVMQDMDDAFKGVDAMIGPCLVGPMLIIGNFTGHPCLVMRSGLRQAQTRGPLSLSRARLDQGAATSGPSFTVPHALCLHGRLFDEGTILRIGRALEQEFAVWDRRPPLE